MLQVFSLKSSSGQLVHNEDAYDTLEITLSTQAANLEVLCELFVEFDNMKDNGVDLLTVVIFQGWERFFNHLQDPVSIIWLENSGFMPNLLLFKLLPLFLERRLSFRKSLLRNSLVMTGLE